jgi:hypothetical protein
MKQYRLGNFARFFGYLFAAGLLGGAYFSAKTALDSSSTSSIVIFHLLAMLCLAAAIFLLREMQFSRFVITVDSVYLVSMIYKRTLYFHQIRGWREVEQEIHIVPNEDSLKKIRVTIYFKESAEIRYFLSEHFPNLDALESQSEEQEILENDSFGITHEARATRLQQARKVARYTEWIGWTITAWLFLYPHPYALSILSGILYPFLAIGVCFLYRGLIRGDGDKKTAYPSVATTFIVVSILPALRAMLDINTLNYSSGWVLMAMIAVMMFVLYQLPTDGFSFQNKSKYAMFFLLPVFTFAYGFGSITLGNSLLDHSQPVAYRSQVTDKRIAKGKSTTYYVGLAKWGDLRDDEEVSVTRAKWEATRVGDSLTVHQYPGFFKMPWIEVE